MRHRYVSVAMVERDQCFFLFLMAINNNNNNRRLVTLAEHTSDHGRQTNSSTEEKGEQV